MRIVVIGDSHAWGMRGHFRDLAAEHDIELVYRAKGGSVAGQWARGLNPQTRIPDLTDADHLVVILGTNDSGFQGDVFPTHMETILAKASAALVPVTWAEPTGEHLRDYQLVTEALLAAVDNRGIQQIVAHPPLPTHGDRIHLDDEGYREFAHWIWDALRRLDQPDQPQPKRTPHATLALTVGIPAAVLGATLATAAYLLSR